MDGLGMDIVCLKRESNNQRHQSDQIVLQVDERKSAQNVLLARLSTCTEKCTQLQNAAIAGFRESQSELATTKLRLTQLEQQLDDKSSLLTEEKNLRVQIQCQLDLIGHSNEGLIRQMKLENEGLLDKLNEIHGEIDQREKHASTTEMLGKLAVTLQSLNSQQTVTIEDVAFVKNMVVSLSAR